MASELKRGTIRLASNYARLFAYVLFGVLFVPIFISGIGVDAFGILGLLGASIGIAEMCQAIVRQSMIRELGVAYHTTDPKVFPEAYNTAIVLCAGLALLVVLLYGGVFLLLPVLHIPDEMLRATQWMLLAKGVLSVLHVLLAPQFNMYKIAERMVEHNVWLTLNRGTDLLAAILLFVILGIRDPAQGLMLFGFLSAGTSAAVLIAAVAIMLRSEKLVFAPSLVSRASVRKLLGTAGWNSAVVVATNLHIRLDQIIMNAFFGTVGNAFFSLGVRLTAYVWHIAGAATDGLDAVSARISSNPDRPRGVADMLRHSTRLQAAVTLPAVLVVIVLAEPLMVLWVGRAVEDPVVLAKGIMIAQILVIGMMAKGISDCWTRLLYGSGHIAAYAPLVLLGGALNPLIAIALVLLLPSNMNFVGPAVAFSSVFLVIHFIVIPFIAARCLSMSVSEVFAPIARPAVAMVIAGPALFIPQLIGAQQSIVALGTGLALFGAIWATLAWWYVLRSEDRARISAGVRRHVAFGSTKLQGQSSSRDRGPTTLDQAMAADVGDVFGEDDPLVRPGAQSGPS